MHPAIGVRNIPAPLAWGSPGVGNGWHHVIPFWLLRDLWNRLVQAHIDSQAPEARVALRQWLLTVGANRSRVEQWMDRMRAENVEQRRASHHLLPPLDLLDLHELWAAAVWPAWNAVAGPLRRTDDPHDRYIDRFTAGLPPGDAARMRTIDSLFPRLEQFLAVPPTPASLRSLADTASISRHELARCRPIPFTPAMWVQEPDGAWRKAR